MKKLLFILIPVLTLLTACQPDVDHGMLTSRDARKVVFHATLEAPGEAAGFDTKTYADAQLHVLWNKDDRISVFDQNDFNLQCRFMGKDGDNSGEFEAIGDYTVGNGIPHIYAVYPYSPGNTVDATGAVSLMLPAEQFSPAFTFGPGANTMISVSDDENLRFKNAGGYLSFKLYGDGIFVKKLMLHGNDNEKLAGAAVVTMAAGGTPMVTMQDEATEYVTLTLDEPSLIGFDSNNCTEFWFVLPPTEFKKGFTLTVFDNQGGVFEKSTDKVVTISRNTLSRMAPLEVIPVQGFVPFADNNFKQYCLDHFDTDQDGQLSAAECARVKEIDVSGMGIKSLQGIENFPGLQELYCWDGKLSSLDLSGNARLQILECPYNELTALDLSHNNDLRFIDLGFNHISKLILPPYEYFLQEIKVHSNELTSLDVAQYYYLNLLSISNNPINNINVRENYYLRFFYASGCPLSSLDLSRNSSLSILEINGVPLHGALDISENQFLRELYCSGVGLTAINLSSYSDLLHLDLSSNSLTSLDLSKNVKLETVNVGGNDLASLDVSAQPNLTELICWGNSLSFLNIGNCLFLKYLDCTDNQMPTLEVLNNPYLNSLYAKGNPMSTLYVAKGQYGKIGTKELPVGVNIVEKAATGLVIDETSFPDPCFRNYVRRVLDPSGDGILTVPECNAVKEIIVCTDTIASVEGLSYFPNLLNLDLSMNESGILQSLDVSGNSKLQTIICIGNKLSSLDLSNNPELRRLSVALNALTALDVSHNLDLLELDCSDNLIESLDVSKNKNLQELYCGSNRLTSLDVTHNPWLESLGFWNNGLVSIDLSKSKGLKYFWCNDNALTALDLTGISAIQELHCRNNADLKTLSLLEDQEIPTLDKDDFTQIVRGAPPIPQVLVGESGSKAWTWYALPSYGVDACWGNCGYIGVGGQADVAQGEIPGYWWGCAPENLEDEQLGHAGGKAYGYGDKDAYMTFSDNGDCISYKADGTQIVKGTFQLRYYDPDCSDGYLYGTLVTTNAPILFPFKINSGGQRVNEFEVIYLDADMMTLIYKGDNEEWGWAESTWWRFKSK